MRGHELNLPRATAAGGSLFERLTHLEPPDAVGENLFICRMT